MFGIYTEFILNARKAYNTSLSSYNFILKMGRTFKLSSKTYNYFIHPYNYTWRNERIVEIPIFKEIILENKGKKILEIGNVLSHYINIDHDVLDKYEMASGVINKDIISFKSKKKYDLIISISTLEHIGWDEQEKDPKKILRAINNLRKHLQDLGEIIFSLPIGYNPIIDSYIKTKTIKLSQKYLLKRISKKNEWVESDWREIEKIKYGSPFPYSNGLIIGVIRNE